MSEDQFLKVAKQVALEAGKIIQKYSGKNLKRNVKFGDASDFATIADTEAEKIIISLLSKNFPDHNILAEEKTKINNNSEFTWAVDPLDGTISYATGMPTFTVSIGLMKNNYPITGVIYHVERGDLYSADSKGAFLNNKRIKVNKKNSLNSSTVSLDFGHKNQRQEKFETYISSLMNKVGYIYSLGSGALSLALVAKGVLTLHIQIGGIWDNLAGTVIVREAGGKVTDLTGKEPNWSKEKIGVIASNGLIHNQILEALK